MKRLLCILCGLLLLVQVMGCEAELVVDPNTLGGKDPEGEIDVLSGEELQEDEKFMYLYFLNPTGEYLVPLGFSRTDDMTLEHMVHHLSMGPPRKEWGKSPIPDGISIQGVDVIGGRALVNLKVHSNFKGFKPGQEDLMVTSIVYSLTSDEEISRIEFFQDNEEPADPFDLLARQSLLTQEDLDLNPLEADLEGEGETVLLWFSNKDVLYMVPVSHRLKKVPESTHELAFLLVNDLIRGPGDSLPLMNSFPRGTEVLSVKVVDHMVEIDFNRLFVEKFPGGSALEWATLNALVLTLTEIPGIQEVQIMVEGRKEEAALGHIETLNPLVRGVVNWVLVD